MSFNLLPISSSRLSFDDQPPRRKSSPGIKKNRNSSTLKKNICSPTNAVPLQKFIEYVNKRKDTLYSNLVHSQKEILASRCSDQRRCQRDALKKFNPPKGCSIDMDAIIILREAVVSKTAQIMRNTVETARANTIVNAFALEAARMLDKPAVGSTTIQSTSERRDKELKATQERHVVDYTDVIVID